ncbi:MAG: GTP cyclohydrolase I FolE, partial [Chlorobiales bacterium]|nr:GTP cyclohydrolase I FolE [Chlorobiales bacterium]
MPSATSANNPLPSGRGSCCDDDDCLVDMHENDPLIIGGLSDAVLAMLDGIGENPQREGLLKTPERVA